MGDNSALFTGSNAITGVFIIKSQESQRRSVKMGAEVRESEI